mgnify:CR=1 FL=1
MVAWLVLATIENEVSDWFLVKVGFREGCVMVPWLFNF